MHSGYEIRALTEGELSLLPEIWAVAFEPFDPAMAERALEYVRKEECYHVGAFFGESLRAVADVVNFTMHLGDRYVPCGGIAGVATLPTDRRRGLVKRLLREGLRHLHERRVPICALWPFSYPFYEKMGWSVTDLQPWINLPITAIPDKGSAGAYSMVNAEDPALRMMNRRWTEHLNLSLIRNDNRWDHMIKRSNLRAFLHADGYMLWDMKKNEQGQLSVREWCYLTQTAFIDGLSLLRQADSQFDRVVFPCIQIEELLKLGVTDPKPQINMKPGMMTRVVHVDALAEATGLNFSGLNIVDPLEVSSTPGDSQPVGPGELIQTLTGFWSQVDKSLLGFHRKVGQYPSYSTERF